ncbi:preprotein translocase subunit SecY [candidate division WOR-3 bacterium]|jgi:preprotein translocase subunit SecY|nr:preprotein translocase subunit SecY [candidate division WOR-3 bacterium]
MFKGLYNAFKIEDLRKKILFTFGIFIIYRIGGHIPLPGVNIKEIVSAFASTYSGSILGFYDIFTGGALSRATIFSLGIMPYISAAIIFELLVPVIPTLAKLREEGEQGRKKITQYTRYFTVLIALVQSYGTTFFIESMRSPSGLAVVPNPGFAFRIMTILSLTTGAIVVMWLGERITEKGIGNGMSLLILIGIVSRFPSESLGVLRMLFSGAMSWIMFFVLLALIFVITAAVVLVTQGQRRIPVQYAKRVVGNKIYGGQSTHLPLNVNAAGVIPIIFAQSILMFPNTIVTFLAKDAAWGQTLINLFRPTGPLYVIIYAILIIFFAYFYTAMVINPEEIAGNMQKYGGFIPGVRPGKKTAEYIDHVMVRITLPGALFFTAIAITPIYIMNWTHANIYFGGTSILITVGVVIEIMHTIESHLLMRHYDGFVKKGKIRGRR